MSNRIIYTVDQMTINTNFKLISIFCTGCRWDDGVFIPCSPECYEDKKDMNKPTEYEIICHIKSEDEGINLFNRWLVFKSTDVKSYSEEEWEKYNASQV